MSRFYLYVSIITLILSFSIPGFTATEIKGTVTAKQGESVEVTFKPHDTAGPKVGDAVSFSKEIPGAVGLKAHAGEGTVTEVNANTVRVKTADNRPNLKMDAVILATGTVDSYPLPKGSADPPREGRYGEGFLSSKIKADLDDINGNRYAWQLLDSRQAAARIIALQALFLEASDAEDPKTPTIFYGSWQDPGDPLPQGVTPESVNDQRRKILFMCLANTSQSFSLMMNQFGFTEARDGRTAYRVLSGDELTAESVNRHINDIRDAVRTMHGLVVGAYE